MNNQQDLCIDFHPEGPYTTTILTPNIRVLTIARGDANQTTEVYFLDRCGMFCYWIAVVSDGVKSVSLSVDIQERDRLTLRKGLTVEFIAQSYGEYIVTASGDIDDVQAHYQLNGLYLGSFTSAEKRGSIKRLMLNQGLQ